MSFFNKLITENYNSIHDGRALWEYNLSQTDFSELREHLNRKVPYVDPRDISLYFAEWWKWEFDGGAPTREAVYNSLPDNFKFRIDTMKFYKLAKQGISRLGIRWNKKQNYLYLRTLLLQGGLPLNHIKENKGKYQDFLFAVLELQPDSVEDFLYDTSITGKLPLGSRHEVVYQNSFEIVRNILDDEANSYQSLLDKDDDLKDITNKLRIKSYEVRKRKRTKKPAINWILNCEEENPFIILRFGFANKYTHGDFQTTFNIFPEARSYQLYLNDRLVCNFRRNVKGDYKTDWVESENFYWEDDKSIPELYFLFKDREGQDRRIIVSDLLQTYPDLEKPTLWTEISDSEWKMARGNAVKEQKAKVFFPKTWRTSSNYTLFSLYGKDLFLIDFEGEVILETEGGEVSFRTNVQTFDWSILSLEPQTEWMSKANMVVVRKKPKILFYNENNELLKQSLPKIEVKSRSNKEWQNWDDIKAIPIGCLDIKFEKDEVVAYDKFYNIGDFNLNYSKQTLKTAEIEVRQDPNLQFTLIEKEIFTAEIREKPYRVNPFSQSLLTISYTLNLNPSYLKIPRTIETRLKLGSQESLMLQLKNPFTGSRVIDNNGEVLLNKSELNINNLLGYRILKSPEEEVVIHLENSLRDRVKINYSLNLETSPLRAFREDFLRLFFLADPMNYNNSVTLTLESKNEKITYCIKNHTDILNIDEQLEGKVRLENNNGLDLYAVPLNCKPYFIDAIPLEQEEDYYKLPLQHQQFVIISSDENNQRFLLPRFVTTNPDYESEIPSERIEHYHQELLNNDYESDIWEEVNQYLKLCIQYDLAFSTFDQLRAIGRSSRVAAKAFFYLCLVNAMTIEEFIQNEIPKIERDLGFCFHWIRKDDWQQSIDNVLLIQGISFLDVFKYLGLYFNENNFNEIAGYITENGKLNVMVSNTDIRDVRSNLGERVLREMPRRIPHATKNYNLSIEKDNPIKLVLYSGIAIAEGIKGVNEKSLWDNTDIAEELRKNVQYVQYLVPDFYKKLILHVLSK